MIIKVALSSICLEINKSGRIVHLLFYDSNRSAISIRLILSQVLKRYNCATCGRCVKWVARVLGIRYFLLQYASYHSHIPAISIGLVFSSHIQVLGIRYFQRPCPSFHCRISVISIGLVLCSCTYIYVHIHIHIRKYI